MQNYQFLTFDKNGNLKKSYEPDYKRLTREQKYTLIKEIVVALCHQDKERPEIIGMLMSLLKVNKSTVYRSFDKIKFDALLISAKQDREKVVAKALIHREANPEATFENIINSIKDFSYLMICTSRAIAETHSKMILYWSHKINTLIEQKGGVHNLDKDESKQIEVWQRNIKHYQDGIKGFLAPQQLTQYLKMVGIEDAVPEAMRDIDKSAFTVHRLQEMFIEIMGQKPIMGDQARIEKVFGAYEVEVHELGEGLPDIKGVR